MRIDEHNFFRDPVAGIAVRWCQARGYRFFHRDEIDENAPRIAPVFPAESRRRPGWVITGRRGSAADARVLPLFPDSVLDEGPEGVILCGADPGEMGIELAMRLTGFRDRDDLREPGFRPVRFRGDPFLSGNGHVCRACGGTGRGRMMITMTDTVLRRPTHLPSWCPSCDGWGRAPGAGPVHRHQGERGASSWRQAHGYRRGLVRSDVREEWAAGLLSAVRSIPA